MLLHELHRPNLNEFQHTVYLNIFNILPNMWEIWASSTVVGLYRNNQQTRTHKLLFIQTCNVLIYYRKAYIFGITSKVMIKCHMFTAQTKTKFGLHMEQTVASHEKLTLIDNTWWRWGNATQEKSNDQYSKPRHFNALNVQEQDILSTSCLTISIYSTNDLL